MLEALRDIIPPEDFALLREGAKNYCTLLKEQFGDAAWEPAGVPGGLGLMLNALFQPECIPVIEAYLNAVDFEGLLKGVALAVTAEGWMGPDKMRRERIVPTILRRCRARRAPVAMIAGCMDTEIRSFYAEKSVGVMPVVAFPVTEAVTREELSQLLVDAADRMFHFIRIGRDVEKIGAPKNKRTPVRGG